MPPAAASALSASRAASRHAKKMQPLPSRPRTAPSALCSTTSRRGARAPRRIRGRAPRSPTEAALLLVAARAGKGALRHHGPRALGLLRIAEQRYVLWRLRDALLEDRAERPLPVGLRQFRVGVYAPRGLDVSLLHQHVAQVEEEALEVVRRDP